MSRNLPPRILVVEDDADIAFIHRVILERAGFQTVLVADGAAALARLEEERVDGVVLDVMLPIVDGWSVLLAIGRLPHPPKVVVCSARRSEEDLARARSLGASEFVAKPFDPEEIVDALRTALGLSPLHADTAVIT